MRQAVVYANGITAGILTETDRRTYVFTYDASYLARQDAPHVSLTMPKRQDPYVSENLFPFFSSLLSEGYNKKLQCRTMQIDETDDFSLLLSTAHTDTVGQITVKEI